MNHFAVQRKSIRQSEEVMMNSVLDTKSAVVCPRPRRLCSLKPLRVQAEILQPKSRSHILDSILTKDICEDEAGVEEAGSRNPFFSGSPPSRVDNPLIHDPKFGDDTFLPFNSQSQSPSRKQGGGCVRANFGNKPAKRIEGFDCLDRDGRSCSIPALA